MEGLKIENPIEVNRQYHVFKDLLLPKNFTQICRQQNMMSWYEDKMRSQRLPWSENVYEPDYGYRIQLHESDQEIQNCMDAIRHIEQVSK